MHNRILTVGALAAAMSVFTLTISAHHGAAAYDLRDTVSLTGTVKSFRWANPHALLDFDVKSDDGTFLTWTAETAGLVILVRAGWTRDVLSPGDPITVVGHRAKNGSPTMILQRIVLSDGRDLPNFVPR